MPYWVSCRAALLVCLSDVQCRTLGARVRLTRFHWPCARAGDCNLRWDHDAALRKTVGEQGFHFSPEPIRDENNFISNHSNVHAIVKVHSVKLDASALKGSFIYVLRLSEHSPRSTTLCSAASAKKSYPRWLTHQSRSNFTPSLRGLSRHPTPMRNPTTRRPCTTVMMSGRLTVALGGSSGTPNLQIITGSWFNSNEAPAPPPPPPGGGALAFSSSGSPFLSRPRLPLALPVCC
jgi:hypothetical protein